MRKFLSLFLIISSLLLPHLALAWYDPGHLTIAAEAYRQLSPEVKAQVFEILKAHPDFDQWQKAYHPNPTLDLPATVFLRSSTWPDEIKGSDSIYDHPMWHFIDYPLRPPNFAFEPDQYPTNNILFGIAQCEAALSDTNASPELRAAYLSFLVHLVGDLHQPLHCESWYNDVYTNGDRGGNDIYVKPGDYGVRLHGIWDGLLGSTPNRRLQWNYGTKIMAEFPRASLSELTADTTPTAWSLESRTLAIRYGYLNGNLKGSPDPDSAPALPDGYLKAAKGVAQRQAALAGCRLADEIQKCLKWGKDLPYLPDNTNTVDTLASAKIGVDDAAKYYDETLVVTGEVTQVAVNPNITILRFKQSYGATPFSAVIFKNNAGQFGDLQKFNHRKLELSGTVTQYRNRPEIVLESTNQVKVIEE
jgi:hypothetical protein